MCLHLRVTHGHPEERPIVANTADRSGILQNNKQHTLNIDRWWVCIAIYTHIHRRESAAKPRPETAGRCQAAI